MRNHILFVSALLIGSAAAAQSLYPGQFEQKIKVENVKSTKVNCLPLSDVVLLPSRFCENMQRDSVWMMNIDINRLLHSFYTNAGVYAGREGGYMTVKKYGGWESLDCELRGHTAGHLMSAYALMYASTGSPEFKLKGDSIVAGLRKVQEVLGNGYVSAFPEELINRNIRGESVWAPWYTIHKILAGLIDQYLYCDNTDALEVATKLGDWIYAKLSPLDDATRQRMIRNEFGGINDALYSLYAITANERYREMAEFFYHNDVIDPLKQHNGDMGKKHTNTFIPKTIAEIRRYELLDDEQSLDLSRFFWNEMLAHHTFPTGELSDKEHFFNPSEYSKHISGYTGETCCTYNMLKLARHLFCAESSADIADYIETATYNHILGQQDPQTGMVCYFLPLATGSHRVYSTPENSFWCCVGSGFESQAKYAENIYFKSDDALYVNLFIASKAYWSEKNLTLTQSTTFPYSDKAIMVVNTPKAVKATVKIRRPSWAENSVVKVNGKIVSSMAKDSYFVVNRTWRNGDKIEVSLDASLNYVTAPDDSTRLVLRYGPIVLAGRLGTEGMQSPAPDSNPELYNDYYTYNYNIPDRLTEVSLDPETLKRTSAFTWQTADGIAIEPLYDIHRERYVVYWKRGDASVSHPQRGLFDYAYGNEGERAYLRLPRGCKEVNAALYCHQNMTEEVLFRSNKFCHKMDSLGVAMIFVQRGSQNWDVNDGCQERFERIMNALALGSGHLELAKAPIIPFGHSAQATFPWNFAAWNPDRTLCIISYHGDAPRTNLCGYGRANIEWGRTRNIDNIPGLMIEGEYEWWEDRVRPALAFRMMYPNSKISFLCDAQRGHFDMAEETQDYMAKFIEKALQNPRPTDGVYYSRWSADGVESTDQHDQFWYQDDEMAYLTRERYHAGSGKQMQYVSARINGELIPYNAQSHIKLSASLEQQEFTLEPVFVNAERTVLSENHAAVKPRIVIISGPVIQTGEYSFRFDYDYFGKDSKRLWSGITLSIEADGDDTYKTAVQELNIRVKYE